jgi:chromodomain-helicase-DNA-binding protein 4
VISKFLISIMSSDLDEESIQDEEEQELVEPEEAGEELSSSRKNRDDEENSAASEVAAQEDDDEFEDPESTKKKKKLSKKRRTKSEKAKKKKKKKKASDSGEDEEFLAVAESPVVEETAKDDSDFGTSKRSSKRIKTPKTPMDASQPPASTMRSVAEICETMGLQDCPVEYTDEDYSAITTYKQYQLHIRPLLQKENPKVPMSKLMTLVAAKWRVFSAENPNLEGEAEEDKNKSGVSRNDEEEFLDDDDE